MSDEVFMNAAIEAARQGLSEGGIPIGEENRVIALQQFHCVLLNEQVLLLLWMEKFYRLVIIEEFKRVLLFIVS